MVLQILLYGLYRNETPEEKRGFKLQRDAKEWERNFLETQQADLTMTFESFVEIYMEDMRHRLREKTIIHKQRLINLYLLPFLGKVPVSQITPANIRKWQNELTDHRNSQGKTYAQTTLRAIHNQLTAILNYAVRYYDLKENPCRKAGSIGKGHADEMQFWTSDEFKRFIEKVSDIPQAKAGFLTLYYTGLRIGELLALEYDDINFKECKLSVNKSYQRFKGRDVITPPKTPKSVRIVTIPEFLRDELKIYTDRIYGLRKHDRIFPCTRCFFEHKMRLGTMDGEVKRIRLHDLRHSHASMLINMGFSPLTIADRLGHEKVETTLNTYSHLFPQKRDEVSEKLQQCF